MWMPTWPVQPESLFPSLLKPRHLEYHHGVYLPVQVADFGLSRVLTETTTHMSTATVGTVTHMPPGE